MKGLVRKAMVMCGVAIVGIQVLPVGHSRSNPPATTEMEWNSAETRELFFRACGDCHSNETRWPWYSRVAPVSWWLAEHVHHGRGTVNVSEWSAERFGEEASEAAETVREGTMPPSNYLWMHPEARLSGEDVGKLIEGLEATFGAYRD